MIPSLSVQLANSPTPPPPSAYRSLPLPVQSFADLERGLGERAPLAHDLDISPGTNSSLISLLLSPTHACPSPPLATPVSLSLSAFTEADLNFKALARSVSIQIHKINANVSAIVKLVDLLGTPKDVPDLRHKLSEVSPKRRTPRELTRPVGTPQSQPHRRHPGCAQGLDRRCEAVRELGHRLDQCQSPRVAPLEFAASLVF